MAAAVGGAGGSGNGGNGQGGGIFLDSGTLALDLALLAQNHAVGGTPGSGNTPGNPGSGSGGGLYSTGILTIANSTISGNSAGGEGGGIGSLDGTLTLSDVIVTNNLAQGSMGRTAVGATVRMRKGVASTAGAARFR